MSLAGMVIPLKSPQRCSEARLFDCARASSAEVSATIARISAPMRCALEERRRDRRQLDRLMNEHPPPIACPASKQHIASLSNKFRQKATSRRGSCAKWLATDAPATTDALLPELVDRLSRSRVDLANRSSRVTARVSPGLLSRITFASIASRCRCAARRHRSEMGLCLGT